MQFWLLMPAVWWSGNSCSRDPGIRLPPVEIEELRLDLLDTAELIAGLRVRWFVEPADSAAMTSFHIYLRLPGVAEAVLAVADIPATHREWLAPLPDTSVETLAVGVQGVHLASTGQVWMSDSIAYVPLNRSSPVTLLDPPEDEVAVGVSTTIRIRPNNDRGEYLRFWAFVRDSDSSWIVLDRPFPFGGPAVIFPAGPIQDSVRIHSAGRDTTLVRWCILAMEEGRLRLVGRSQSLTCSRFYRTAIP